MATWAVPMMLREKKLWMAMKDCCPTLEPFGREPCCGSCASRAAAAGAGQRVRQMGREHFDACNDGWVLNSITIEI